MVMASLHLFRSKTITFFDCNGLLMIMMHLHMVPALCSSLVEHYCLSLLGHLQKVDTAQVEGANRSCGQAVHFDWYNRYSTMVSLYSTILTLVSNCLREMGHHWTSIQALSKSLVKRNGQILPHQKFCHISQKSGPITLASMSILSKHGNQFSSGNIKL